MTDSVTIKNLTLSSFVCLDNWSRARVVQPSVISARCNIPPLSSLDTLSLSVNYSTLAKQITKWTAETTASSAYMLAIQLSQLILSSHSVIKSVDLTVTMPRALLLAESASICITRPRLISSPDTIKIKNLQLSAIIGLNACERLDPQKLLISLEISCSSSSHNLQTICKTVQDLVAESNYKTIEALAVEIARCCIVHCKVEQVSVCVDKPNAIMFADAASVQVTRSCRDYPSTQQIIAEQEDVILALGSNLGNACKNIEDALCRVKAAGIKILDTSFMYCSDPMYVELQPKFLNCCAKVSTTLSPPDLLETLLRIELEMGRDSLETRLENGPRVIDLDIIFYGNQVVNSPNLIIPHPKMQERLFVLRPLVDIDPHRDHRVLFRTPRQLLSDLTYNSLGNQKCVKVFPIRNKIIPIENAPTVIMGILNITPDSFSDGGLASGSLVDIPASLAKCQEMVDNGALIVDVGGCSTRPGSVPVSEEIEMERVVDIVTSIRSHPKLDDIIVSVDTFRVNVARAAVNAGADIINDITGGFGFVDFDGGSKVTAMNLFWAESGVGCVVMHMRGSPTEYKCDLIQEVGQGLTDRIHAAVYDAGVYRWKVLADPGIGFAKNSSQNFEILRRLDEFGKDPGFPLLIGPSRKGFIGQAIGSKDAKDAGRLYGTCAACTAAIKGGCVVLRVHDVKEIWDAVRVADQCFKEIVS